VIFDGEAESVKPAAGALTTMESGLDTDGEKLLSSP